MSTSVGSTILLVIVVAVVIYELVRWTLVLGEFMWFLKLWLVVVMVFLFVVSIFMFLLKQVLYVGVDIIVFVLMKVLISFFVRVLW